MNIQDHYLAWPKDDRRKANRRDNERRSSERRQQLLSEKRRSETNFLRIYLTQEEKSMIRDLYLENVR